MGFSLFLTKNNKIMTCIHKHYSVDEWENWYSKCNFNDEDFNYVSVSTGISQKDFEKTGEILNKCPKIFPNLILAGKLTST